MLTPVSVHAELQVPASECGGLRGEENGEKKNRTLTKTWASLFFLQTDWLSFVSVLGKRHKTYLAIILKGREKSKNLEFPCGWKASAWAWRMQMSFFLFRHLMWILL